MKKIAGLIFGLFLLTACARDGDAPRPPEILYGQDLCTQCGMVIDDPRFAAASLLNDGEVLKFDDVGEMLIFHMDHPEKQVQAWQDQRTITLIIEKICQGKNFAFGV